jgi:hypothetical protein
MRYGISVLLALGYWGAATPVSLIAFFVGALSCDDACGGSGDWSRDASAWQWDAIQILAVSLFFASASFLITIARRRPRRGGSLLAYGLQLIVALSLFVLVESAEVTRIAPPLLALALGAEVCALGALWARHDRWDAAWTRS